MANSLAANPSLLASAVDDREADVDLGGPRVTSLTAKAIRGTAVGVEARLDRLEAVTEDLDRRIDNEAKDLRELIPRVAAQHAAQVRGEMEAITEELGTDLRITKLRAKVALGLLLAGATCSAGANIAGVS